MTKGQTSNDGGALRNMLLAILAFATAAGLVQIILSLTQDCLNEVLLALGIVNLGIAGIAAASLQQGETGTEKDEPHEGTP